MPCHHPKISVAYRNKCLPSCLACRAAGAADPAAGLVSPALCAFPVGPRLHYLLLRGGVLTSAHVLPAKARCGSSTGSGGESQCGLPVGTMGRQERKEELRNNNPTSKRPALPPDLSLLRHSIGTASIGAYSAFGHSGSQP